MTNKPTNIIITHPVETNDLLTNKLILEGLNVIVDPMIETHPINLSHVEVTEICNSDLIIFTSKRGVKYTTSQINPMCCHDKKVVVVGKKTALALSECDIQPYLVSQGQTGKEMCESLLADGYIQGKQVIALLAQLADDTIEEHLSEVCQYKRIDVYQTSPKLQVNNETKNLLSSGNATLVTFTSSSAVKAFSNLYPDFKSPLVKCISIGPVTSKTIINEGQTVAMEAKKSTYEGLLECIKDYLNINAITP